MDDTVPVARDRLIALLLAVDVVVLSVGVHHVATTAEICTHTDFEPVCVPWTDA